MVNRDSCFVNNSSILAYLTHSIIFTEEFKLRSIKFGEKKRKPVK